MGGRVENKKLDGKWEGLEEFNKPRLAIGVTRLRGDFLAMGSFKKDQLLLQRKLIAQRQAFDYLMGDARGLGFGSVLWGQGIMISESGEFTLLYQGR